MNNNDQNIQQVELTIEEAKKIVAFGEAISRLEKNRDYRTVFVDGYFRDEASRLALLSGDQNIDDKTRELVMVSVRSIGELFSYLRVRKMLADQMHKEIFDNQEELDRLRGEDDFDAADEEV